MYMAIMHVTWLSLCVARIGWFHLSVAPLRPPGGLVCLIALYMAVCAYGITFGTCSD